MNRDEICLLLANKIKQLKSNESRLNELLPDVHLLHDTKLTVRTLVMHQSGIVSLFSEHKISYINGCIFRCDADGYLLLTIPLLFGCETYVTPEVPLAGICLNVDILQLRELLMDVGEDELFQPAMVTGGISSATSSGEILCAAECLLDMMERLLDAHILGKQTIRRILCHMLIGPHDDALLVLTSHQTYFSLAGWVLKRIRTEYAEDFSIEQLAAEANMSVSVFHHNSKAVTSASSLQYPKSYRLHKARTIMVYDGMKASAVTVRVSYESASQFSQEPKRFFGVAPGEGAAGVRMVQGS